MRYGQYRALAAQGLEIDSVAHRTPGPHPLPRMDETMHGESRTLSPGERSELFRAKGSYSNTSSAAPAIHSYCSASTSTDSSTQKPREVLLRITVGFLKLSCALLIMCWVSRVGTACQTVPSCLG